MQNCEMQIDFEIEQSFFYACKLDENYIINFPKLKNFYSIITTINNNVFHLTDSLHSGLMLLAPNWDNKLISFSPSANTYGLFFNNSLLNSDTKSLLSRLLRENISFANNLKYEAVSFNLSLSTIEDIALLIKSCIFGQRLNVPSNYIKVASSIISTIIEIISKEHEEIEEFDMPVSDDVLRHLQLCLDYIENNYMYELSTKDLAQKALMSETGFRRLFSKTTGMPFKKYITKRRISQAILLLDSGSATQREIAYEVGYKDMSTFYRNFSNETNMTPTQYLKRRSLIVTL